MDSGCADTVGLYSTKLALPPSMCGLRCGHHLRRECVTFLPMRYSSELTTRTVGLAMSFLQASKEEWSLVRRHPSESIFGMQIAGSKPQLLVPAAEIIGRECTGNLDFVDVNCGCPIDLVYKTGSGSARMSVLSFYTV